MQDLVIISLNQQNCITNYCLLYENKTHASFSRNKNAQCYSFNSYTELFTWTQFQKLLKKLHASFAFHSYLHFFFSFHYTKNREDFKWKAGISDIW